MEGDEIHSNSPNKLKKDNEIENENIGITQRAVKELFQGLEQSKEFGGGT